MSAATISQVLVLPLNDALKPYVSVFTYNTPEYHQALQDLVPGESQRIALPMLPYSVIVRNRSDEPLRGINVVFRKIADGGSQRPYSILSWNLDSAFTPDVISNKDQFFSPLFPLNRAVGQPRTLEALAHRIPIEKAASDLSREKQITFSVEFVIDSHGVLIGPDSLGNLNRISAEQRAQAWLANRLNAVSGSPEAQMAELRADAAIQVTRAGAPFHMDFYNSKIQGDAALLLKQIETGRRSAPDVLDAYVTRVSRTMQVLKQ